MERLLADGVLQRESSGPFFVPLRARSTCSGDIATDTSSMSFDDVEEEQNNTRRISLCKQVLLEATTKFNAEPLTDSPLFKGVACRNSGALLPLLSMLAAEQEPARTARCLDTLSFLLLDRANRRACHELRALDVLLDILRRSSDQQVLHSTLDALCGLCKHDAKDKMALWQHPKKGALLSMLSSRQSSSTVVETLRTCRTLCFAMGSPTAATAARAGPHGVVCTSSCCPTLEDSVRTCQAENGRHPPSQPSPNHCRGHSQHPHPHHGSHHHDSPQQHQSYGSLQLLEPGLLTVASELLHPSTDAVVLLKALKLLHSASGVVSCALNSQSCCGCWHNAVFRIVPLLTHCGDVDVVEAALAVLVNLSEHHVFHNMFFASGCIPPLLHLLSHKRCAVSQSASCVLSALSEGGLSRDKLCQDTALLAMLRVLQTNHCVVVTLGVLYMLGRLAGYRAQVVRSLKGWGAIPLLMRLMATTQDEDASEGCKQLLQVLGVKPPPVTRALPPPAATNPPGAGNVGASAEAVTPSCGSAAGPYRASLHVAHSSIAVFSAAGPAAPMPINGMSSGNGALCRTISAAASVAAAVAAEVAAEGLQHAEASGMRREAVAALGPRGAPAGREHHQQPSKTSPALGRLNYHSSFRFYGGAGGALCGPMGPIAAAVPPAAAY